ncbi:MAG: thiamine phosphate synthase [Polyangiaceae bacterium]
MTETAAPLVLRGLYAILDLDALGGAGLEPVPCARALLEARPCALQLRAKQAHAREALALLEALLPLCRAAEVPLFMNDRPDLALLAGVDGVHLGQDDLPLAEFRRLLQSTGKRLWVGISTHDVAQLREVLDQRPDYVAFGPVFPTRSKQNPDAVVGLDQLAEVHALTSAAGIPLVGIGGITRERAFDVSCRAESGAVIGDLLAGGGGEIAARASELQRLLSA